MLQAKLVIAASIFAVVFSLRATVVKINGHPSKPLELNFDKRTPRKISKLSMGVEHLVDCGSSSTGFLNSDMCFDHDINHVMQMLVTDMFERMVTIGILVVFYYYFKRLAITQPIDSSMDSNGSINRTNDYEYIQDCPKCNGTGRNLFNKSMLCDLCGGSGKVEPLTPKRYNLPARPYDSFNE